MGRRFVVIAVVVGVAETVMQAASSASVLFATAKWTVQTGSFTWWQAFTICQALVTVGWAALVSYVAVCACRQWAAHPAEEASR